MHSLRAGASVAAQLRTVAVEVSTGAGVRPPTRGFARAGRKVRVADVCLALFITGLGLVHVVRLGEPADVSAGALAAAGALCLAWRRDAPLLVLLVSAASFCLYQALDYPHQALPFAVLIALYTVASRSGTLAAAVAAGVVVIGAAGADITRKGWPPNDYDDALFAYALSVGAACALGYAVQLSRARTQLLREQAAALTSEHAAHEQQALQLEQARIARELHDVIAHQVSLVTALAAGAKRVLHTEPELAREALDSIEVAGREALTEMRRFLRVLRADTDEVGRVPQPCLEQLPALVAHTEAAGLPVRLSVCGAPRPLPAGVEVCAYRIVQEALTNTLKHAGPARASVRMTYRSTSLELDICDDGRGMRPNPNAGNGLIGMHERAALVGGRLVVGAGPSGGVEVNAWLPTDDDHL
jgi:signal transduction histidine kinase